MKILRDLLVDTVIAASVVAACYVLHLAIRGI